MDKWNHATESFRESFPHASGVKLYGVDSVFASTEDRKLAWSDLAKVPPEAGNSNSSQ